MNRILYFVLMMLLIDTLGSTDIHAQESSGQLWFCWEATVHPDLESRFVELQASYHNTLKEHGFPYSMYTWNDSEFGYYFFYPVDSYEDKSAIYAALGEAVPSWGEDNWNRMWETVQSHRTYFLKALPEITYQPQNPRLDQMEMPYAYWDILYVIPGKEATFTELMKKLGALEKDVNYDDPIQMLTGDVGYEGSVYIGALKGKDAIDFRTSNQRMTDLIGEEWMDIFRKALTLTWKRESKEFWYLPDLSYFPE